MTVLDDMPTEAEVEKHGLERLSTEQLQKIVYSYNEEWQVPYSIDTDPLNLDQGSFADCVGKVYRLRQDLLTIGLHATELRIMYCAFEWSELLEDISKRVANNQIGELIKDIKYIPHSKGAHVYLEVYTGHETGMKWLPIDPTWDPGLSYALPSSPWSAETGTLIAVKSTEEAEILPYEDFLDTDWIDPDLRANTTFFQGFNELLSQIRQLGASEKAQT